MRVYHGTSADGAAKIRAHGIDITASTGGYFGVAFYVAENRDDVKALAQLGDDETGTFVILEFEFNDADQGALDLCGSEADWNRWLPISKEISWPDIAARAARRGIRAVRDINSMGGWAVYDPSLLALVDQERFPDE